MQYPRDKLRQFNTTCSAPNLRKSYIYMSYIFMLRWGKMTLGKVSIRIKTSSPFHFNLHFSQFVTSAATSSHFAHKLSRVSWASCKLLQYSPYFKNLSLYSTKISPILLALCKI